MPETTLASVIADLGGGIVRVAVAPDGLDIPVGTPVIHDPVEESDLQPGDLVLAVGIDPAMDHAPGLVRRAGSAGAAALLFKSRGGDLPEGVCRAARDAGVAVLVVGEDVAWGQLHGLLRTARATRGGALDTAGIAVPLGDLFALANAVASMVGGPTTIEDPQSVVLAYSTHDEPIDRPRRETILGRHVPEPWLERLQADGVFRRLWSTDDIVRIDYSEIEEGFRPRMAVAVRAGDEILGSIWVAEGHQELGPDAEVALREAARIAALHLVRHRSSDDLERRRRGEELQQVLEGGGTPELLAELLGVPAETWATVLAFAPVSGDAAERALHTERAVDLIALHFEAFRRAAGCVAIGSIVYVVAPDVEQPDADRLTGLAWDVIERSGAAPDGGLRSGIGSTVRGLSEIPRSRHEADQVLRVLATVPEVGPVAHIEEVRSRAILHHLADLAGRTPGLRRGKVETLIAHDREHGSDYVPTLRAYLDAFGHTPTAARDVNVHPNTFRYRLKRLTELSGLDMDDPVERLVAHLQVRLLGEDR